jgi:hypothetical protein
MAHEQRAGVAKQPKDSKSVPIVRVFGQPNRWTFTIFPIKQIVGKYAGSGLLLNGMWVDPFAGKHSPAKVTNDINPDVPADYHMDALQFLREQPDNFYDGAFYDPPYSITQAKQVYDEHGTGLFDPTKMDYWSKCKDEIARILKPSGTVMCFGWNSNGLGKSRGFRMVEILIVPHGGQRNDTIVTVEVTDLQPSNPDTTLRPSKAQTKAHTSKGGLG